jgi:hypothetical protein
METKICSSCFIEKNIEEFNKNKNTKDGLQFNCRLCCKKYKTSYYSENKEKILKRHKKYYKNNKEKILKRVKDWCDNNGDKTFQYKKKYVEKNKEKINQKMRERKKNEPILKLKMLYRSKINKFLGSKREKTFDLIGCTPEELKKHLEKKFQPGMSWENHGIRGWHIDHIVPISSAKNEEELKMLCHFTNLQPLWGVDNIRKRNKIQYGS